MAAEVGVHAGKKPLHEARVEGRLQDAPVGKIAGAEAVALIDWTPDPGVTDIVAGWPARFDSARAARLGLTADPDYADVIRRHQADTAG